MVGEVRDEETAEICLRAALTGHFVLSTIHTNDALSAVTRLQDMGIDPFLLSCSLRVLEAQRLVRRLCPHCKEPYEVTPELATQYGFTWVRRSTAPRAAYSAVAWATAAGSASSRSSASPPSSPNSSRSGLQWTSSARLPGRKG